MDKALQTPAPELAVSVPSLRGRRRSRVRGERFLLKALLDQMPDFLFIKDTAGRFVIANEAVRRVYGLRSLVGKTDHDLHPKERADEFWGLEQEIIRSGVPNFDMQETFPDPDGVQQWYSTTKLPLRDAGGTTIGLIGIARNITARKKMELFEARQSKMLEMIAADAPLEAVFEALVFFIESQTSKIVASILLLDENGCLRLGAATNLPKTLRETIDGVAFGLDASCGTAADIPVSPLWRTYPDVAESCGLRSSWSTPIVSHHGAMLGTVALYSDSVRSPTQAESQLAQTASRMAGIAIERHRAEKQLRHMAHHDALTSLPNRVLFLTRLNAALHERRTKFHHVALHYIDLDGFKKVNDGLGHYVGDVFLREVASRLRATVASQHTVARLGGDEFAVIQILSTGEAHAESAQLAFQILEALDVPYEIEGNHVLGGASIGATIAPEDDDDPEALLRDADLALYQAKADRRGGVRFFEPVMHLRAQKRRLLEEDLRRALDAGEFELYYQPQIDLVSNEICGFEALLRWRHPDRGMVPPLEFVGVAEEIGLIVPLGAWAMHQACIDASHWPRPLKVAVNLSPVQFRNNGLLETVKSALATSGIPADRLELEITESVLLIDSESNTAVLHQIRALGVQISLDDFGTGYSSLSYLRLFPFTKIKIDRSFVRDLDENRGCLAIIRAVSHLASDLGMRTTVEGVETARQLEQVRNEGCDEAQGFLFSPPASASEAYAMLCQSPSVVSAAA